MRVTRKDVAELAGVSGTTVSFALSGKRYVSEDLVKKVNDAVAQLGYLPDMAAKTMRSKKTYSIAVLINDFSNPLHMQIIESIENYAMKNGYFVNICGGNTHLERYINEYISRRVDGVFIIADAETITGAHIQQLLDKNISVAFGSVNDKMNPKICGVGIDFKEGMNKIISYLKSIGHKDIAYISAHDEDQMDERLGAFYDSMKNYFGNARPIVEKGDGSSKATLQTGYALTKNLIKRTRDFTALVCMNDMMALGAISAIQDAGLKVPDDISVVGIDDITFSGEWSIGLTTLSHKAAEFGEMVFEVLQDNIVDKSVVGRKIIMPELIIRKSTKKID